jgi:uncharacterized OB-fold protein
MIPGATLELTRCGSCHARFLPTDGPCPRCGSSDCAPYSASPMGRVLAATELHYPASGWHAPHRLALIELADAVRVLAIVDGPLPAPGDLVEVRRDGDVHRARPLLAK